MKEMIVIAEIKFNDIANKSFRFPVTNPIRMSLWLPKARGSSPSEITAQNEQLQIGKTHIVEIMLIEIDLFVGKIIPNQEFEVGLFPTPIASGKILEIKSAIE